MTRQYYDHYNEADLAAACDRGATVMRKEAAEALTGGDQPRHDRKLRGADFAAGYAEKIRAGEADPAHAQVVAHAANMSGILVDGPMPDDPWKQQWDPDGLKAEQELAAQRKSELESAAAAGLVSRVDDPGQVPFYTLAGYEPDGYDPATKTTDLRDRATDGVDPYTASRQAADDDAMEA